MYENYNMLFSEITGPFLTNFYMKAFSYIKMKICRGDAGHMAKIISPEENSQAITFITARMLVVIAKSLTF